jgi:hypothetical protein
MLDRARNALYSGLCYIMDNKLHVLPIEDLKKMIDIKERLRRCP